MLHWVILGTWFGLINYLFDYLHAPSSRLYISRCQKETAINTANFFSFLSLFIFLGEGKKKGVKKKILKKKTSKGAGKTTGEKKEKKKLLVGKKDAGKENSEGNAKKEDGEVEEEEEEEQQQQQEPPYDPADEEQRRKEREEQHLQRKRKTEPLPPPPPPPRMARGRSGGARSRSRSLDRSGNRHYHHRGGGDHYHRAGGDRSRSRDRVGGRGRGRSRSRTRSRSRERYDRTKMSRSRSPPPHSRPNYNHRDRQRAFEGSGGSFSGNGTSRVGGRRNEDHYDDRRHDRYSGAGGRPNEYPGRGGHEREYDRGREGYNGYRDREGGNNRLSSGERRRRDNSNNSLRDGSSNSLNSRGRRTSDDRGNVADSSYGADRRRDSERGRSESPASKSKRRMSGEGFLSSSIGAVISHDSDGEYDPEKMLKKAMLSSQVKVTDRPSRRPVEANKNLVLKAVADADRSIIKKQREERKRDEELEAIHAKRRQLSNALKTGQLDEEKLSEINRATDKKRKSREVGGSSGGGGLLLKIPMKMRADKYEEEKDRERLRRARELERKEETRKIRKKPMPDDLDLDLENTDLRHQLGRRRKKKLIGEEGGEEVGKEKEDKVETFDVNDLRTSGLKVRVKNDLRKGEDEKRVDRRDKEEDRKQVRKKEDKSNKTRRDEDIKRHEQKRRKKKKVRSENEDTDVDDYERDRSQRRRPDSDDDHDRDRSKKHQGKKRDRSGEGKRQISKKTAHVEKKSHEDLKLEEMRQRALDSMNRSQKNGRSQQQQPHHKSLQQHRPSSIQSQKKIIIPLNQESSDDATDVDDEAADKETVDGSDDSSEEEESSEGSSDEEDSSDEESGDEISEGESKKKRAKAPTFIVTLGGLNPKSYFQMNQSQKKEAGKTGSIVDKGKMGYGKSDPNAEPAVPIVNIKQEPKDKPVKSQQQKAPPASSSGSTKPIAPVVGRTRAGALGEAGMGPKIATKKPEAKVAPIKKVNDSSVNNNASSDKDNDKPKRKRITAPEPEVAQSKVNILSSSSKLVSSIPPTLKPSSGSSDICKFWPNCTRGSSCFFYHPKKSSPVMASVPKSSFHSSSPGSAGSRDKFRWTSASKV